MDRAHLTAAASSINLSQPAMSAAVARLRNCFNDELFTMSGRECVLTRVRNRQRLRVERRRPAASRRLFRSAGCSGRNSP
ncbi:LysR family transcriptional regulator [Mesorhizobium sanjuanii]|uniref:LysR family transcriptional regulator n=1 Tax=Mesorhizobium sanjuanii TaxID=2037900 RepID=A0A2A6FEQ4_9HYPH|nr:LysR family transcriptional regulator [Mesorhizobium sanjuanii]